MKTVFIFILGMLIAIFLLLPDKSNGVSSIDNNLTYEVVAANLGKDEPKKMDEIMLNFLKKVVVTRTSNKERSNSVSQTNSLEYNEINFQ